LAGAGTRRILDAFQSVSGKPVTFDPGLYGNGNAAGKIVEILAGHKS